MNSESKRNPIIKHPTDTLEGEIIAEVADLLHEIGFTGEGLREAMMHFLRTRHPVVPTGLLKDISLRLGETTFVYECIPKKQPQIIISQTEI